MKCEQGDLIILHDTELEESGYRIQYVADNGETKENYGFDQIFDSPDEASEWLNRILNDPGKRMKLENSIHDKIKGGNK